MPAHHALADLPSRSPDPLRESLGDAPGSAFHGACEWPLPSAAALHRVPPLRDARRILVSQTNGLGDVIHSLPAIHAIAASAPRARIDLLCGAHAAELASIVPAISSTLVIDGYPKPKNRLQRNLLRTRVALRIAGSGYDAIVDLGPKDRSVFLLGLSGAPQRIAVNFNARERLTWFYTHMLTEPWRGEPYHRYLCRALRRQGFAVPYRTLADCPIDLSAVCLPLRLHRPYLHLSLFGTEEARQLPIGEARALVRGLLSAFPDHRLAISCSAAARETAELRRVLVDGLAERVELFAGTLSVPQLTRLIAHAALHIGPDTGSLHLAVLTGCRSVSWFINKSTFLAWAPRGAHHHLLLSVGEQEPKGARIRGIRSADIVAAAHEALQAPPGPARESGAPNLRYFMEGYLAHQDGLLRDEAGERWTEAVAEPA